MNRNIEKLALEAGAFYQVYDPKTFMINDHFDVKKFAELIVRECAYIADKEYNILGCGYITKTKGMRIQEHFGVEE